MSFTLDNIMTDGDIEVILKFDSALDVTGEEYDSYLENLDESLLKFKDGELPTKFVMRRNIPLKHATRIENGKLKYDDAGEVSVGLSFIIEEVRAALKDIKYDSSVPQEKRIVLKFTGDGLVEGTIMGAFVSAGIVQNLYRARTNYLKNVAQGTGLKKS